jgi:hypothetical protein
MGYLSQYQIYIWDRIPISIVCQEKIIYTMPRSDCPKIKIYHISLSNLNLSKLYYYDIKAINIIRKYTAI